jgi:heat shock protein HtpX
VAIGWVLAGPTGVAWTLAASLGALLLTPRLSPGLILRMYRARPLSRAEAPGLYALVERLAAAAELPARPVLYYVPTSLMNAFSVGPRKEAVIAVTDGLLRGLSPREVGGVIAHEVSHIRHNDMWIMSLADLVTRLVRGLSILGQILVLVNLPMILLEYGSLPWLPILLLVFAPTLSALLQLALSRNREFDADLEAARLTGDPLGLAQALARLEHAQERGWSSLLFPGRRNPQPSLLRTHPNSEERIARLRSLVPELPPAPEEPPGSALFPTGWDAHVAAPRHRWHGLWY